jgi:hypothetical protein
MQRMARLLLTSPKQALGRAAASRLALAALSASGGLSGKSAGAPRFDFQRQRLCSGAFFQRVPPVGTVNAETSAIVPSESADREFRDF